MDKEIIQITVATNNNTVVGYTNIILGKDDKIKCIPVLTHPGFMKFVAEVKIDDEKTEEYTYLFQDFNLTNPVEIRTIHL